MPELRREPTSWTLNYILKTQRLQLLEWIWADFWIILQQYGSRYCKVSPLWQQLAPRRHLQLLELCRGDIFLHNKLSPYSIIIEAITQDASLSCHLCGQSVCVCAKWRADWEWNNQQANTNTAVLLLRCSDVLSQADGVCVCVCVCVCVFI